MMPVQSGALMVFPRIADGGRQHGDVADLRVERGNNVERLLDGREGAAGQTDLSAAEEVGPEQPGNTYHSIR